jgi:TolB protein
MNMRARLIVVACLAVGLAAVSVTATLAAGGVGSAKNGRIVFQVHVGRYAQLFTINPSGTGLKQVTHIAFSGDTEGAEQASWAPDGSTIAFDGQSGNRVNLFTIRPDGTGLAELLPLAANPDSYAGAPAYSPDGTKIAFDQDYPNSKPTLHGIFIANADGSDPRRVTTGIRTSSAYDTNADWSPDGSRLTFTRVKDSQQAAVFVVNTNGSGLTRLTPWQLDAANGSWSPDGSKIVFDSYYDTQYRKSANLFTVGPSGGAMTQLTHLTGGETQAFGPVWSPDGKEIVWHKKGPGVNQLFLMDARGGHVRQLTHLTKEPSHADWGATS